MMALGDNLFTKQNWLITYGVVRRGSIEQAHHGSAVTNLTPAMWLVEKCKLKPQPGTRDPGYDYVLLAAFPITPSEAAALGDVL